jgi:ribosomal protein L37AE/L43A
MAEKTGEMARETANYRCERCHRTTHVDKGAIIPACRYCGFETFDLSNPRFEAGDGTLGPHEPG